MEADKDSGASNSKINLLFRTEYKWFFRFVGNMQNEKICAATAAIIGAKTRTTDPELVALLDKVEEVQQECVEVIEAFKKDMKLTKKKMRELS